MKSGDHDAAPQRHCRGTVESPRSAIGCLEEPTIRSPEDIFARLSASIVDTMVLTFCRTAICRAEIGTPFPFKNRAAKLLITYGVIWLLEKRVDAYIASSHAGRYKRIIAALLLRRWASQPGAQDADKIRR